MANKFISNEVGATVFAVLTGLGALFFGFWAFGTGGCSPDKSGQVLASDNIASSVAAATSLSNSAGEEHEKALATLQADLDAEAARRADLAVNFRELKGQNEDLSLKLEGLNGKLEGYDALAAERDKLKASLGEIKGRLSGQKAKIGSLEGNLGDLKAQLKAATQAKTAAANKLAATMKAGELDINAQAQADKLKARLRALEQKLNGLGEEKVKLSASIQAKDAEIQKLKAGGVKMEAGADDNAKKLQIELDALKKSAAQKEKNCQELTAKLQREIVELKAQVAELKSGDALKSVANFPKLELPMLINDPRKLDASFKPLFIRLRELDDNVAAREKLYAELAKGGNNEPILRVPFGNAKSDVSEEYQKKINDLVKSAGKGAKFLAVGYASTDGKPESNHKLSSERASNVAQQIGAKDGRSVQAVYFGQTTRFSSELAPNRVVEVWRVK